jgi:pyruvate kinase
VFRLNFSHGTHADHSARLTTIRALEAETGTPIAILADLQAARRPESKTVGVY